LVGVDRTPQPSANGDTVSGHEVLPVVSSSQAEKTARGLGWAEKRCLQKLCSLQAYTGLRVSVKKLRQTEKKTGSTNAAFSRMLVWLERRKPIVRTNWNTGISGQRIIRTTPDQPPVAHTSHVILTSLGKAVTKSSAAKVNKTSKRLTQSVSPPAI
jgi:hypothetical protein